VTTPLEPQSGDELDKGAGSPPPGLLSESGIVRALSPVRTWRASLRRATLIAGLGCLVGFGALYLISSLPRFKNPSAPSAITDVSLAGAPAGEPGGKNAGGAQGAPAPQSLVAPPAFVVKPGKLISIPVQVPDVSGGAHLVGSFTTAGGRANDVEVFVTDRSGLSSLTGGSSFTAIYASGRVTSGNIEVVLPPGSYYLVFSNVFSLISAKAISTKIELRQ
jgi:hypothetical protein